MFIIEFHFLFWSSTMEKYIISIAAMTSENNKFPGVEPCVSYNYLVMIDMNFSWHEFFCLQAVTEEEGLHQVEVVTSEAKALEAVVLTMEAEATEGAS